MKVYSGIDHVHQKGCKISFIMGRIILSTILISVKGLVLPFSTIAISFIVMLELSKVNLSLLVVTGDTDSYLHLKTSRTLSFE